MADFASFCAICILETTWHKNQRLSNTTPLKTGDNSGTPEE
jgi:hypothetical protein